MDGRIWSGGVGVPVANNIHYLFQLSRQNGNLVSENIYIISDIN